jgi:anthraniloyl-CoA monooxygenase
VKVAVIGGGPAGLYFALLLRKARPDASVTVFERNRPDDTFGWGVVFSDQTMEAFRAADRESFDEMTARFAHWDDIDVHFRDRVITSSGHGFAGIARKTLLGILQSRCGHLGVDVRYRTEIGDDADLAAHGAGDADVVVAADGINSVIRARYAEHFRPDLDVRTAKFV